MNGLQPFPEKPVRRTKFRRKTTPEAADPSNPQGTPKTPKAAFIIPDMSPLTPIPRQRVGHAEYDKSPAPDVASPFPADTALPSDDDYDRQCPICSDIVEEGFYKSYSGKLHTFNQQMRFCTWHKRKSAEQSWASRGYPRINWSTLTTRILNQHEHLKAIIKGKPSHFRDALTRKIDAGQDRTIKKTGDQLTPGYYGPRGMRVMSESLIAEFSTLLRRCSIQDKVISARGHTSFVQAVLVPELAVHLIMEDMQKDEDDARKILYDSIVIGELLHEDVGDRVLRDRDSDSEDDDSDVLSSVPSDELPEL